jgi:hypothetical protein
LFSSSNFFHFSSSLTVRTFPLFKSLPNFFKKAIICCLIPK